LSYGGILGCGCNKKKKAKKAVSSASTRVRKKMPLVTIKKIVRKPKAK